MVLWQKLLMQIGFSCRFVPMPREYQGVMQFSAPRSTISPQSSSPEGSSNSTQTLYADEESSPEVSSAHVASPEQQPKSDLVPESQAVGMHQPLPFLLHADLGSPLTPVVEEPAAMEGTLQASEVNDSSPKLTAHCLTAGSPGSPVEAATMSVVAAALPLQTGAAGAGLAAPLAAGMVICKGLEDSPVSQTAEKRPCQSQTGEDASVLVPLIDADCSEGAVPESVDQLDVVKAEAVGVEMLKCPGQPSQATSPCPPHAVKPASPEAVISSLPEISDCSEGVGKVLAQLETGCGAVVENLPTAPVGLGSSSLALQGAFQPALLKQALIYCILWQLNHANSFNILAL